MDSPQNQIWGPHLWIILHSMAERIGLKTLKRLPMEEKRLWTILLSSLKFSLPCPLCKKHYTDYYTSVPLPRITAENVREWLFNLHNSVNLRTDKPNTITIEQISEIYSKPFNFSYHFSVVSEHMGRALRLGWSSRDDIQKTIRIFSEMKRFYDLF